MKQLAKCEKRRFDEVGAKLALAGIAHRDNPNRTHSERRAYYHTPCDAWHLTSMPRSH